MSDARHEYWTGLLNGISIGVVMTAFFCAYLRDRGRDECDAKLPRNEQCVQVWVPPTKGVK